MPADSAQKEPDRRLILIGGPSASGKSTLAHALRADLGADKAVVFPLDAYYRDLAHLNPHDRANQNFDRPDALEWSLLKSQIRDLLAGRPIARPVYSFADHIRLPQTEMVHPAPWMLVEGVHALWDADLNTLAALRIYVDAGRHLCLERRTIRDIEERGRTSESVERQFNRDVWPMTIEHVHTVRRRAGLVVSGTANLADTIVAIRNRLYDCASHVSDRSKEVCS